MQLRHLQLVNFRSFSDETVSFEKKLTVLVGENNGGKSNLIDAIRLISAPLGGRREIYCEQTDIRFGSAKPDFEITATFSPLTPAQQGRLLSATTDDTLNEARFGLTYDASGKGSYIRPTLWAGRFKTPPEPGCHEMIRHVYLPPLRDAKRALASGNPARIYALLDHFLEGRDPDDVARNLARPATDDILTNVGTAVNTGLEALTTGVRQQNAALGFNTDEKLIHIARDLRFKLADHGITPEDLQYSGLGFANLLYLATIAVELEKVDDAELTLFLVEEPEAHLHPQLQAAVLNFLEECAEQSLKPKPDPDAPAGNIQIVVATHSPNLSAWVSNENLVFVRSVLPVTEAGERDAEVPAEGSAESTCDNGAPPADAQEDSNEAEPGQEPGPPRRETRCIPIAKLGLTEPERRKIDRYLDVTKSALLFGGRVLLVEGIAEALLLPIIAKQYVLKDKQDSLRIFRSAVFVPIDGTDFMPYARILLTPFNGTRIADRLVIVTDGDKTAAGEGQDLPGNRRKTDLEALAATAGASSLLDVVVNTYSLEPELVGAGNTALLKTVYLALHPRSEAKWDAAANQTGNEQAHAIQDLFKDTRKGDFAHILADKIAEGETFNVPPYIRQAIEALVR
ncbi:MAG: AAA family ATPase [Proteobacteria bacterium]|nr:AAA family ATPase [Pseudomonadota bacterium]